LLGFLYKFPFKPRLRNFSVLQNVLIASGSHPHASPMFWGFIFWYHKGNVLSFHSVLRSA